MGKDKNSKKDRKDKKRKRDKEDEEDHRKAKAEKLVSVVLYTSNLLHWQHPAFATCTSLAAPHLYKAPAEHAWILSTWTALPVR